MLHNEAKKSFRKLSSKTPEGAVLKAVCEYLAMQERLGRCWFNRQNNGGVYDAKRGVYRLPNGVGYKHGAPDIVACIGGRYVALEVEASKGVQSEHQKSFRKVWRGRGGLYLVVRGVEDVEPLFRS
jgi:hypothetical protein